MKMTRAARKATLMAVLAIAAALTVFSTFLPGTRVGDAWHLAGWVAASCWALASASFSYYRTLDGMSDELKAETRFAGSKLLRAALYFLLATGLLGAMQVYETIPGYTGRNDALWGALCFAAVAALGFAVMSAALGIVGLMHVTHHVGREDDVLLGVSEDLNV